MSDNIVRSLRDGFVIRTGNHKYKIVKKLSAGGFGITYLIQNLTAFTLKNTGYEVPAGELLVLKECYNDDTMARMEDGRVVLTNESKGEHLREQFYKEAGALANRMNLLPWAERGYAECGFVPIYHTAHLSKNLKGPNLIFFVMPYLKGGSLKEYIQSGASAKVTQMGGIWMSWLLKLLNALSIVHADGKPESYGMKHCDIKPANIMFTENMVPVLIDFGAVTNEEGSIMFTRQYAPWEQWGSMALLKAASQVAHLPVSTEYRARVQNRPQRSCVTPRSDLYSLAATFFHLLTGTAPPEAYLRLPVCRQDHYVKLENRKELADALVNSLLQDSAFIRNNNLAGVAKARVVQILMELVRRFLGSIDKALSPAVTDRFPSAMAWRKYVFESGTGSINMPIMGEGKAPIPAGECGVTLTQDGRNASSTIIANNSSLSSGSCGNRVTPTEPDNYILKVVMCVSVAALLILLILLFHYII